MIIRPESVDIDTMLPTNPVHALKLASSNKGLKKRQMVDVDTKFLIVGRVMKCLIKELVAMSHESNFERF